MVVWHRTHFDTWELSAYFSDFPGCGLVINVGPWCFYRAEP